MRLSIVLLVKLTHMPKVRGSFTGKTMMHHGVTGQWLLYFLVHGMEKLWHYRPEAKTI